MFGNSNEVVEFAANRFGLSGIYNAHEIYRIARELNSAVRTLILLPRYKSDNVLSRVNEAFEEYLSECGKLYADDEPLEDLLYGAVKNLREIIKLHG